MLPRRIVTKVFVQEVIALHRIRTSGPEIQQQGKNQATIKNLTHIRCDSGRGKISNLDTTFVLLLAYTDPGIQRST